MHIDYFLIWKVAQQLIDAGYGTRLISKEPQLTVKRAVTPGPGISRETMERTPLRPTSNIAMSPPKTAPVGKKRREVRKMERESPLEWRHIDYFLLWKVAQKMERESPLEWRHKRGAMYLRGMKEVRSRNRHTRSRNRHIYIFPK